MSAADGWLAWNAADNIVKNYQNNNQISGQYRLYTRDQHGNEVAIKAWWWKREHITSLLAATDARLASQGKTASGVRLYPALQNKDENGNSVPDFHTLVLVGTVDAGNGIHNNVQLDNAMDYIQNCPHYCPQIGVLGY